MNVGDLSKTTEGRLWLNTDLLPNLARSLKEGAKVLFVGTDSAWDYKALFFNPSVLTEFITMDPNPSQKADIVAPIENCPQVKDNTFDLIILIGVYEFVEDKPGMFKEINRILKPDGMAELSLPGPAAYESPNNHIEPWDSWDTVKPLRIEAVYVVGERDGNRPSSIHILGKKT